MPALVRPEELQPAWVPPATLPLDEGVWKAWIAKGRAKDRLKYAARLTVVKWFAVAGLIGAAILWPYLAPFELATRSVLTIGALVAMFQAFREVRFVFAALFGLLAVLFNPIVHMLAFSSDWQRGVVVASALIMSLNWRKRSINHNA